MNNVQIIGIALNLIIYFIITFPLLIICFIKKIYSSKEIFIKWCIISTLIEIVLSIILYTFSKEIFFFFPVSNGIKNYAVYASKILFITSSFYSLKFLIPTYLFENSSKSKTLLLVFLKIILTFCMIFILNFIFNTKGIFYAFPICDLIFYVIYIVSFIKVIKK